MKQLVKYHLAWIRKKLRYSAGNGMNGHGMTYHEFEIIVEVIRYYAPVAVEFGYRLLKDTRKSIMQMRSMRTEYRQPFGASFFFQLFVIKIHIAASHKTELSLKNLIKRFF